MGTYFWVLTSTVQHLKAAKSEVFLKNRRDGCYFGAGCFNDSLLKSPDSQRLRCECSFFASFHVFIPKIGEDMI